MVPLFYPYTWLIAYPPSQLYLKHGMSSASLKEMGWYIYRLWEVFNFTSILFRYLLEMKLKYIMGFSNLPSSNVHSTFQMAGSFLPPLLLKFNKKHTCVLNTEAHLLWRYLSYSLSSRLVRLSGSVASQRGMTRLVVVRTLGINASREIKGAGLGRQTGWIVKKPSPELPLKDGMQNGQLFIFVVLESRLSVLALTFISHSKVVVRKAPRSWAKCLFLAKANSLMSTRQEPSAANTSKSWQIMSISGLSRDWVLYHCRIIVRKWLWWLEIPGRECLPSM